MWSEVEKSRAIDYNLKKTLEFSCFFFPQKLKLKLVRNSMLSLLRLKKKTIEKLRVLIETSSSSVVFLNTQFFK